MYWPRTLDVALPLREASVHDEDCRNLRHQVGAFQARLLVNNLKHGSASSYFFAAIAFTAAATWMAYSVYRVELLRSEGVPVIAQVTGTRVHHSSEGEEITQTYAYSDKNRSGHYTGSFTAG